MIHCYPFLEKILPEAKPAMDEIVAFIKRNMEYDNCTK